MGTSYLTVFDASALTPLEIWLPAASGGIALVFSAALWFKREHMMPNRTAIPRMIIAALALALSAGWTGLAVWRAATGHAAMNRALHGDTLEKAEGYVTRFKPQFGDRDFMERFCVNAQPCFSYSPFLPGPAFHTTGTIQPDMRVRVYYTGNDIIRLDIVPMPRRQPAAAGSGDGTE